MVTALHKPRYSVLHLRAAYRNHPLSELESVSVLLFLRLPTALPLHDSERATVERKPASGAVGDVTERQFVLLVLVGFLSEESHVSLP